MKLENVQVPDVLAMMAVFQPDWMIHWADQQDLKDALEYHKDAQRAFLIGRARPRVEGVLRAAWAAGKKREKELEENSAKLARDAGL